MWGHEAEMEMFILSVLDQELLESSEQGVERKQDFSDFSLLPVLLLVAAPLLFLLLQLQGH